MKLVSKGVTRHVVLIGSYAIKFPRLNYGWRLFLRGLLANIDESETWRNNSYSAERLILRDELLCPVHWLSWGGWVLIMSRADVSRHELEVESLPYEPLMDNWMEWKKVYYNRWIDAGFGGDDKPDNYGYLRGRLVKVDYS